MNTGDHESENLLNPELDNAEQGDQIALPDDVNEDERHAFLKAAAEAVLFASTEPVAEAHFTAALGKRAAGKLPGLVAELNLDYRREGRAFEILHVAGGYQYFTRPDFSGVLKRLTIERARTKLSRAALETLAVVAFRGPVTRAEIDEIRGVDSGGVLRTLLDRRLAAVRGRAKVLGRPLLYETTPEFLKHFGLADLSELPRDSELLREWGQPRSIDDETDSAAAAAAEQVDLDISESHENGRLVIQPTNETEIEKDTES